jgi:hypothetical protein
MSRLPGKKLRQERFQVDGRSVEVEVRILDEGEFYAHYAEVGYRDETLAGLREQLRPVVQATNRLEYEPIILINCHDAEDRTSRWHNGRESNDVELTLGFEAGWKSTTPVGLRTKGDPEYRWVAVATEDDAVEVERPEQLKGRDYGDRIGDGYRWVAFTPERWRTLHRIRSAMISARERIAEVMADETGTRLDGAAGGGLLLGPVPGRKTR